MGKIVIIVLVIIAGYYVISWMRREPAKSEAPLLPESYDHKSNPEKYGAASYYASALERNRYDLLVAAASLPPDDWPQYTDTMVRLFGRREEILAQCANAFNETLETDPRRAVNEDIHALLGLARQFGYGRLISDGAATGIIIEMNILGWFEHLLPDLPAEAAACFSKRIKAHWEVCERKGPISKTMPGYLEGCVISEPRWKDVAVMEEELVEMRRSMRRTLAKMGYWAE